MSSTFTGLLRTLKSTSSARDSMLLSSCECELTELMHQIDLMVEKKRLEWQHQIQGIQSQCERKDRELMKLRETVEFRNKEMGQLQQKSEFEEENHRRIISKYESQLTKLKNEMENLKKNYGKLQRNSSRQSKDAERIAEQITADKDRDKEKLEKATITIEELQNKANDLQADNELQKQKLKGLEEQRGSFIEKCEVMQSQLVSYQGQLARKKQMLEGLEQKHVARVAELENEILQFSDELKVKEETITSLKAALQESRLREENGWKEQMLVREESEIAKSQLQKRDKQVAALENELRIIKMQQKKFEAASSGSRTPQDDNILAKSKEQEDRLKELERRFLNLQNEYKEKLQNEMAGKEQKHAAEVMGMKQQVTSYTEELHRRDVALAQMSERAGRMEEDLREISSKHDKKEAELQISNAQLEALRLENRHLRDTSVEDHLSTTADLRLFETQIAEIEGANARVVAQLEDENAFLKSELSTVREEHIRPSPVSRTEEPTLEDHTSSPRENTVEETNERFNSLQEQLNQTLQAYEAKLQELQTQKKVLKDAETQESGSSEVNAHKATLPKTANAEDQSPVQDDADLTNMLDFLGDATLSSERGSRRTSLTREFLSEEDARERELQQILESRISDLEQRTNATLKKYNL